MSAPDWLSRLFAQPTIRNGAGTNMPSRSNIKFVGPTVTDDAANDQTIVDTTGGAVTLAGDAVGPAGSNTVQTLTGSAGVVSLVAAALVWAAAAVSPSISQAISTTGAGQNMSVSAQAAKAGSAANGGSLILSGGLKDGAGADGDVIVCNGGTEVFRATADTTVQFAAGVATPTIKQAISTSGAGVALLISAQDAKAGSAANGGDLKLQGGAKDGAGANGNVVFARLTGTTGYATISTTGVIGVATLTSIAIAGEITGTLGASVVAGPFSIANFQWITGISPQLSQAAPAATGNGANFTIAPQVGGATSGIPGTLVVNIAVPNGGSAESYVTFQRGGAGYFQFGPLIGVVSLYSAIYPGNVTPSATNYAMYIARDGSSVALNATSTGNVSIGINNTAFQNINVNGVQFFSATMQLGSGTNVIGIANASANPTTNPTGGGVLYASGGALYWRGSNGTVTQVATA